ncbi:asparagine synthetase B family protein [Asticcacaulis sp. DW145]|uniref:asparagine synthetase B family protein n=1 Tax=Asticcacaulis sp. DW145 TaxID=3095608 RepID=UPI003090BE00|nr:asparagine synthetase B family protein [Asticcacaulis sp. DW145]
MAPRFIGLVSDDGDAHAHLRDRLKGGQWQCVCASKRLSVFTNGADVGLPLADQSGAVAGHLFNRPDFQVVTTLANPFSQEIVETQGRLLVTACWGGYVAFVTDADGHTIHVLRDPSGAMPCVYTHSRQDWIFASDITALSLASQQSPTVDTAALARFLMSYDLRDARTCLSGIEELLAGFRLSVGARGQGLTAIWSPWDFVEPLSETSPEDLASDLRTVVLACVNAWAGRFAHTLLSVSGGLDSSILTACLKTGGHRASYLTLATNEAVGDERAYARVLAAHLKVEITEAQYDMTDIDVTRSSASHLPRPVQYAYGQGEHAAKLRIVRERGIDALMTGIGGDNVFCSMHSGTPLVDSAYARGLRTESLGTLMDICALTGASVWEIGGLAIEKALAGNRPYRWLYDDSFLHPDVVAQADRISGHPWLTPPKGALPGKAAHIVKLVRIQGTIDGFSRDDTPPQINPLLSQPIVEACLRIPTWEWVRGGRDRSIARLAFAGDLPAEIVQRRSKGGPDSFAFDIIDRNRRVLCDRLVNGELRRLRLIDPVAIHDALDPERAIDPMQYLRLSGLAEAEAWVRHWGTKP